MKKIVLIAIIYLFSLINVFSSDITFKIESYENKLIRDLSLFFNENKTGESLQMQVWSKNRRYWQNIFIIPSNLNYVLWSVPDIYSNDEIRVRLVTYQSKQVFAQTNVLIPTAYRAEKKNDDLVFSSNEAQALIFPNPSSDKISLDLGGVALSVLVVYDILGNEIMSIPNYNNKSEIDISILSIGTYTIQVQTSTGNISQRLLVNR